ncbi:MAG: PSD1 and planctomycete cytochrome C domain-containing protein [Verrucomicrobiota bacterium]
MNFPSRFSAILIIGLSAIRSPIQGAAIEEISPENLAFFETKIRPLFAAHCLECHSAEKGKVKGGLNMDSRESLLKGGESGAVIKADTAEKSTLIQAVEWSADLQMPPKKKLSDEQITSLKEWITRGAPDPREGSATTNRSPKEHWAFQPVARPTPPSVKNPTWSKSSIDRFILAKLDQKGLLPSDPPDTGSDADRRRKREALLRRAYFDLIGMPPTPSQIRNFTNDPQPNAFEKVIDELLASPAYGERWARHWLDTARYSDTAGGPRNNRNNEFRYAYAWSYRDWVITAINKDMPYDQFVLNQLAADKIPNNSKENLAALGFLTVGERFRNEDDTLNDRIDAVGRGFLGLTIACARCHDHKFDPITQADYYALKGIFASCIEPKDEPLIGGDPNSKSYQTFTQRMDGLEKQAHAATFQMLRANVNEFHNSAAEYFEAAYMQRTAKDRESRARAEEFAQKHKLDGGLIDQVSRHTNPNDPVLGPFVQLIKNSEKPVQQIIGKTNKKSAYNPLVIDHLSSGSEWPGDITMVAASFSKFCRTIASSSAPRANLNVDPVLDLEKGGIFKTIANSSKDKLSPEDKARMSLAVFPFEFVPGELLRDMNALERQMRDWDRGPGGRINPGAIFNKINELKLTFRGGPVRAMAIEDLPSPVDLPIFPRGNAPKTGDKVTIVPRRFIQVLSPTEPPQPFSNGSGRLELAQSIANKNNPLTARVMVNRVWMHHFGDGLVRTPDDLGNQAGTPTHPELLDFLSSWFMEDLGASKPAWSVKALHKAIMLSNVYQQSSQSHFLESQKKIDAGNSLLWRANIRRLDFEAFRDALLCMAGAMDTTLLGPSVNLASEPYSFRRSVYGYIDRSNMPDLFMHFDMANPNEPNSKRTSSIVPQQALFLMNSPFTLSIAQKVVQRPEVVEAVVTNKDARSGILNIFQIVLQRTPTKTEFEMALRFLQTEAKEQAKVASATAKSLTEGQKKAEELVRRSQTDNDTRKAVVNEGELVRRTTLSPWESLVQALMFCNESAYLN